MMNDPVIWWVRRDLRLADNPALTAAARAGCVIPVFVHDGEIERLGAAPAWRYGEGLGVFDAALRAQGLRLVFRKGDALSVLRDIVAETGARAVHWTRAYDLEAIARDTAVKASLKASGVEAQSHGGHVLFEPWTVQTGQGSLYKVYTPFWKAVRGRDPGVCLAPAMLRPPKAWPRSLPLEELGMGARMRRGAEVLAKYSNPGAEAAQQKLAHFMARSAADYKDRRDFPAQDATSGMSEYLTYGEISARQVWHAGQRGLAEGLGGAEHFLKELVWREFAYHLMFHAPHILTDNWRAGWEGFAWTTDPNSAQVLAWKQGRTGIKFVDAAMREMYVTGRMHNRARMIVASYLTKHLLAHWRIGQAWFADCLTDWDIASNAMGWQWVAGTGPDASPFFRVFNPDTQAEKFDGEGAYRRRWIAEGVADPSDQALDYFRAVPRRWGLSAQMAYPAAPIVGLREGRAAALLAYENREKTPLE